MKKIATQVAIALILSAQPALAQTIDDTIIDPTQNEELGGTDTLAADTTPTDGTDEATAETEPEGMFSRLIPSGLKAYFSEEEEAGYQARLDEAATPQERNEVRRELQRENQARHLEKVQATKREKHEEKGLFEAMADDFNDIVSGEAANDGYERSGGRDRDTQVADRSNGKGKERGGNGGGRDRGGNGRGNGGGNGGGKNR